MTSFDPGEQVRALHRRRDERADERARAIAPRLITLEATADARPQRAPARLLVPRGEGRDVGRHLRVELCDDLGEQVVLRLEVVEEAALADASLGDDSVHAEGANAVTEQDTLRGLDDFAAGAGIDTRRGGHAVPTRRYTMTGGGEAQGRGRDATLSAPGHRGGCVP